MRKNLYINGLSHERTTSASTAKRWHENGDPVTVCHDYRADLDLVAGDVVTIPGAPQETSQQKTDRENFDHCKRICDELETYADGRAYKCPDCGAVIELPDTVGEKFKCPHCGEVHEVDDLEQLGLYDYFDDLLDIDYVVNYRKEYKACRILVAFGGPNIYIDTLSGYIELYWWGDRARYKMLSDTITAVDEWAEEYFSCL